MQGADMVRKEVDKMEKLLNHNKRGKGARIIRESKKLIGKYLPEIIEKKQLLESHIHS
jgi:hypothetical protein